MLTSTAFNSIQFVCFLRRRRAAKVGQRKTTIPAESRYWKVVSVARKTDVPMFQFIRIRQMRADVSATDAVMEHGPWKSLLHLRSPEDPEGLADEQVA